MIDLKQFTDRFGGDEDELATGPGDERIEFLCREEHDGVIPEPEPAAKVLPDWYTNLAPTLGGSIVSDATVRRCGPFLDALSAGWIVKFPATVELNSADSPGTNIDYEWKFDSHVVSNHSVRQVGGEDFPRDDVAILKCHTHWYPKLPEGYTLLVLPPLNRIEPRFETLAGFNDFDQHIHPLNTPFMWEDQNFHGTIDYGTPVAQVIPIERDGLLSEGTARAMTDDEAEEHERYMNKRDAHVGFYRENIWQPKSTRMVSDSDE